MWDSTCCSQSCDTVSPFFKKRDSLFCRSFCPFISEENLVLTISDFLDLPFFFPPCLIPTVDLLNVYSVLSYEQQNLRTFEIKIQCVCYSNEANAFRIHATFDCRLMPFASRESPQCLRTRGLFLRCSITSLHCAVARRLDCDGVSHLFDQARIFILKI